MSTNALHAAIMNIQADHEKSTEEYRDRREAYIHGHRDARHAAAELVAAAPAADAVASVADERAAFDAWFWLEPECKGDCWEAWQARAAQPQQATLPASEPDDEEMSLIESQVDGLLDCDGAGEDHAAVIAFFVGAGLRHGIAERLHQAIIHFATRAQPQADAAEPVATVPVIAVMLDGDAAQAHDQCRAVIHMALALADVYRARAMILAAGKGPIDIIGDTSAAAMEWLGDTLNNMDGIDEGDLWLDPIFDRAQQRWPAPATHAQPAPQALGAAEVWHAVLSPSRADGVIFKDRADADWTATGRQDGRFGVPTLGDSFREIYDDTKKFTLVVLAAPTTGGQS